MIIVEQFSKAYQEMLAVRELSFTVESGQILGLVGRNGAGKTTTLRTLAGIIPGSSGRLSVDGFDLVGDPLAAKKLTAYVPDDPQLFNDLSVEQHLKFTASVYEIEQPAAHIVELLKLFELESKRHTTATELSRGMRQKLAICCAYLSQPKALLLDEPMTGLDPQAIRVLKQSILQIAKSGSAVIISSHLLAMVEDICSHALILDSGQTKFFGTLNELQTTFGSQTGDLNESSLENAYFAAVMGTPTQPFPSTTVENIF
ncbi:ABC transporter ATP-binding protein [Saprospiraceae bacterium]|nr:ABC transporter ATP-binding protein [Saprospiraceae bacterium]